MVGEVASVKSGPSRHLRKTPSEPRNVKKRLPTPSRPPLVETAKANGHEPYAYLRHVFAELPKAQTAEQLAALLPYNIDPGAI